MRAAPALLASAGFARAFTLTVFAAVFGSTAIRGVSGDVTLATIVFGLCALGVGVLVVRRREIELVRLAPTTLVLFLVWAGASVLWSADPLSSLGGWAELVAVSFLAVVIGHVRDALQTVRALGDVLRWLLGASLALEILSGILLDLPIPFLGIQGDIASLGPVQGLFGTRNVLGFVTVIALITFLVEYRTQSVRAGTAIASVVLAGSLATLSGSPTVIAVAVTTGAATLALTLVRRLSAPRRPLAQLILGVGVIAAVATGYGMRDTFVAMADARADFSLRTDLWSRLLTYVAYRPVEGFGWFGTWSPDSFPFASLNFTLGEQHTSALDAYLDVLLQLGWVGLLLFLTLGALALARGWLVATERRSIVHAWGPLTLVALLTFSLFESFTLSGAGLLLLVVCAVRAGQSRSWRESLGLRMPSASAPHEGPGVQGPPTAAG
ncbi:MULTISPECIES: O-antigen ligase family protein [Microbacterium]|uniref:O-antigen ligase family protein n=1 Tax=Microbacterium TaxID=33882 RepID=UPI00278B35E2|nr:MULTISPECIES: O-antigen ligase family protein [Microbacterium]MDQ1073985.1 exopolysaccharide production protein ExoQ [Microbacterium sp. SORGH_AS_0969]MDQ1114212.1 exopolysaccharide production protein ExoQ [Microbacterium testaceum]